MTDVGRLTPIGNRGACHGSKCTIRSQHQYCLAGLFADSEIAPYNDCFVSHAQGCRNTLNQRTCRPGQFISSAQHSSHA
eukprot:338443-Pelagomonas_calceolata.AAC.1